MSGMRVAVGLPTLPPEARQRRVLDAVLGRLHRSGIEVEGFAERPRDRDGDDPFPVHHYLRAPERHRQRPFDAGLYLLGRDMRAYEPPYVLSRQFPGATWVLDPVVHHLALGGMLPWSRWDRYRHLLEAAFGPEEGGAVALTVASGWGVRALYRRRDPVLRQAARQPAVAGATPAIVRRLQAAGASAALIPVPTPEGPSARAADGNARSARPAGRPLRRLVVVTLNYAWPEPALRGLSRLAARHRQLEVEICAPQIVLDAGLRFPADADGLRARVRWLAAGDWPALAEAVDGADAVVHLRDDPTVGERVLMQKAMADGRPVVVLAAEDLDEYPEDAVLRVPGGRGLGAALEAGLGALIEEPELAAALGDSGRRHVEARPDPVIIAERLRALLETAAAAGFHERAVSGSSWRASRASARNRCTPASATAAMRALVAERVDGALPAGILRRVDPDGDAAPIRGADDSE